MSFIIVHWSPFPVLVSMVSTPSRTIPNHSRMPPFQTASLIPRTDSAPLMVMVRGLEHSEGLSHNRCSFTTKWPGTSHSAPPLMCFNKCFVLFCFLIFNAKHCKRIEFCFPMISVALYQSTPFRPYAAEAILVSFIVKEILPNCMGKVETMTRKRTGTEGRSFLGMTAWPQCGRQISHCSSSGPESNLFVIYGPKKESSGSKVGGDFSATQGSGWVKKTPEVPTVLSYSLTNKKSYFPNAVEVVLGRGISFRRWPYSLWHAGPHL